MTTITEARIEGSATATLAITDPAHGTPYTVSVTCNYRRPTVGLPTGIYSYTITETRSPEGYASLTPEEATWRLIDLLPLPEAEPRDEVHACDLSADRHGAAVELVASLAICARGFLAGRYTA